MTETRKTTEELIAIAYTNWTIETGEQWMPIETLAGLVEGDDLNETIADLMTDDGFRAEPQPFGHRITDWDRKNAPVIGGEARHLISWE